MHSSIYRKIPKGANQPKFPYRIRKDASVTYLALRGLQSSEYDYSMLEKKVKAPEKTIMIKRWTGYEKGFEALFMSYEEARWFDFQGSPYWPSFHGGMFMMDELLYSELGRKKSIDYPEMTYLLDTCPFSLKGIGALKERVEQFILGAAIESESWRRLAKSLTRDLQTVATHGYIEYEGWCNSLLEMCRYVADHSVVVPVYDLGLRGNAR